MSLTRFQLCPSLRTAWKARFVTTLMVRRVRAWPRLTPLPDVARMLREHHGDHYMIYNLSERPYDYAKFDNQVHPVRHSAHACDAGG